MNSLILLALVKLQEYFDGKSLEEQNEFLEELILSTWYSANIDPSEEAIFFRETEPFISFNLSKERSIYEFYKEIINL